MSEMDFAAVVERLAGPSDDERWVLLRNAAQDDAVLRRVREAHAILVACGGDPASAAADGQEDEIALELAQGKIRRSAVTRWRDVEWLVASLRDTPAGSAPAASRATRRAMREIVLPARPRTRWWWSPALATALAVVVAAVGLTPSTEPWNESLQLSRWRVWRLPDDFVADVRDVVENGRLAPALFELPEVGSRPERDGRGTESAAPVPLHPRWEAVIDDRPTFRWSSPDPVAAFEVLLIDEARQLVWSATSDEPDRLTYPADRAPLVDGGTYTWKVNRLGGQRLVPSEYVRFKVLAPVERRALAGELSRAAGHPFLRGTAYDRHGLYTRAAGQFERAGDDAGLAEIARRARRIVRAKQGFGE